MAKIKIECKIQIEMLIILGIILFFKLIISYVYKMHDQKKSSQFNEFWDYNSSVYVNQYRLLEQGNMFLVYAYIQGTAHVWLTQFS